MIENELQTEDPHIVETFGDLSECTNKEDLSDTMVKLLREGLRLVIDAHPCRDEFASQLDSGELKSRLENIGESFDPNGRVAFVLEAKDILEQIKLGR